jgi:hypothetical protein
LRFSRSPRKPPLASIVDLTQVKDEPYESGLRDHSTVGEGGVRLRFDRFGCRRLEASRDDEPTLDGLLALALAHFAAEMRRGRPAATPPRFGDRRSKLAHEVELSPMENWRWEALEEQAGRWGIAVERLVEHALLLYLADLDFGRIPSRLARGEG